MTLFHENEQAHFNKYKLQLYLQYMLFYASVAVVSDFEYLGCMYCTLYEFLDVKYSSR